MDYSKDANAKKTNPKKKKGRKRKNSVGVILLRIVLVLVIIGIFAVGGAVLGAYMGIIENVPPLNISDVVPESYTSIIYDSKGNEIDILHGEENREYVKLSSIPKNLQNAVIAIEDERFYSHNGIDFKGMMRALVVNLQTGDMSQGASTITQQLIKNELLTSEKKLTRKIQEQYLAVKLEDELTEKLGSKRLAKDHILELYLNTIGLNHGLNGVEAAAKFYYGKDVGELTLAECASIAGITKNPSLYSPVSHPDKNKERQILVLDKMKELELITDSEYYQAKAEDIYSKIVGSTKTENDIATHNYFIDSLIVSIANDLHAQKNMSLKQAYNMIYSGGLKIYSTVDMDMQQIMEESYKNDDLFPPRAAKQTAVYKISIMDNATEQQSHYKREKDVSSMEEAEAFAQSVRDELLNSSNSLVLDSLDLEDLQSAMVVMDFHNGEVKALVGGRGEKKGDLVFNRATQALRQPGSCFKVLAGFAPAIDLGILSPGSIIVDEEFSVGSWRPKNWWSTGYRGPSTVREGIRDSMNILAAKTVMMVGVDQAFDYLINFGFTSLVESEERNGQIYSDKAPASVLGGITDGVSVLELTAAYGAIANNGEYNKPIFYTKILDHDGNVYLDNTPQPKRILKETTSWLLTDMMKDVVTGGGTGGLARFSNVKMPIAGKTGTTTDDKDLTFAGYTPYYVAGIWLGYDTPKRISYKKSYHLLLWSDVMEKIHANLEYKDFDRPAGIVTRSYCNASGDVPVSGLCENDYYGNGIHSDYAAADAASTNRTCEAHQSFQVCRESGKIPGEFCPEDEITEVILAVEEIDGIKTIVNKPGDLTGKMDINLNGTCDYHTSEPEEAPPDTGVIGADDPILPTIPVPPTITDPNIPTIPDTPNIPNGENDSPVIGGDNLIIPPTIPPNNDNTTPSQGEDNTPVLPPPTDTPVIGSDDMQDTQDDGLYIPD